MQYGANVDEVTVNLPCMEALVSLMELILCGPETLVAYLL